MRNRVNIRKSKKSYQNWLQNRGGYDVSATGEIWEGESPFAITTTSPLMDDAYEKLEDLYYDGILKGRQREIVSLLMDGVFNEREIARRLGIDFRQVGTHLARIRKKLLKDV